MYRINNDTGKVFLTDGMVLIVPNTQGHTDYVVWLSADNTPVDTDYLDEIDINEIKVPEYQEKINNYFSIMYIRALSSSMNKSNKDINYLLALKEEYTDKYNVSKGTLTSGDDFDNINASILGEMEDEFTEDYLNTLLPLYGIPVTGTHLQKMYSLIVFKYEFGLNAYISFSQFIRRFRSKSNKWIGDNNFAKLDTAFSMVDDLPGTLSVSEAEILFNQFKAL